MSDSASKIVKFGRVEQQSGPTEPLPPMTVRRWPRWLGFLWFLVTCVQAWFFSVVGITFCLLIIPLDRKGNITDWMAKHWWTGNITRFAGVKWEVITEAPLPDGPVVFVCNHQSNFDIMILFCALPRRFVFVAKKEVFNYPFIGWHIRAQGYIPVDRSNRAASIKSLEVAGEKIRAGTSVTLYPEGTRSPEGLILPFKKGPFMLALKAGVPIVPVAVEGAQNALPRKKSYCCPNTVRVIIGPAIETKGLTEADRDDLIRVVRSSIVRQNQRAGGKGGGDGHIAASGVEGIGKAVDA